MKRIVIVIIMLLINNVFSQHDGRFLSEYHRFQVGSKEYLFADNVKFRTEPTVDSEVIELLDIGTEMQIIEEDKTTYMYEGKISNWYKVKVGEEEGYILGALIAIQKIKSTDTCFYFQLKEFEKDVNDLTSILKIRHVKNGAYTESEFRLIGDDFSLVLIDHRGLEGVRNILVVDYIAEGCGGESGVTYFLWNGNEFTHLADLSTTVDADIYYFSEKFIFPNDPNGMKGKIVYHKEEGELKEEEPRWFQTKSDEKWYSWSNYKLTPNFDNKD